ncbi:MAG TPA: hypothetical protein VKN99_16690 [Polyangia bacterium]|nr:hypothetical protein [Polyangia bacterium]
MGDDLRRLESAIKQSRKDNPPYRTYAFANAYNLSLLGGFAATAALTQNWWFGILGAGLEALWMLFAPDSKLLRRLWFDKVHAGKLRAQAEAERKKLLATLPEQDAERVRRLDQKREQILTLCNQNRALTVELLHDELAKLEQLAGSFVDLVVASHRYEDYMSTVDLNQLERDIRQHTQLAERTRDEDQRKLAQKNLAVLERRREKMAEIQKFISKARGQMNLIENTFELLADQIVTMRSPQELGGQLDELIDGVEAVRTTARETEALMQSMSQ